MCLDPPMYLVINPKVFSYLTEIINLQLAWSLEENMTIIFSLHRVKTLQVKEQF